VDEYAPIAYLYDHVGIYHNRPDVGFFVDAARESGGPVLEIGSGTGRVLIPTARAGIDITGLDASPSMLAVCRERLADEPDAVKARVTLVQGDMRSFDLGVKFSLITIPFRPFQHLTTVTDQLAALSAMHRHLVPGGRLILDLFNPSIEALAEPAGKESAPEDEFTVPDGRRVTRRFKILARDRASQVNDIELIYDVVHPDGRTERLLHAFQMRYLFRFEAEHLLVRAGFDVEHLYAGYDKSPFGSSDPGELIFVARCGK
jgi:SAM-dependent methyltransferase